MTISFDRIADRYDETRSVPPEIAEQITAQILRLGRTTPDTHFFEAGIGTGRIALPMVERGYAYTGVDISEAMMNQLRQKVAGTPHRLTLLKADATALPLEADQFDVAIAAHILHLIPAWQQALGEIRRVLKPDGVLIYFHHSTNKAGVSDVVSQQWRQILQGYGYQSQFTGAVTEEVLDYLTQRGAELETVTIAEIPRTKPLREVLQAYEDRIYSNMWRVPDDIYPSAFVDLQTWAMEQFKSLEVEIESRYSVTLTAASGWA
jgi:ubiquinone/menaquinone biosynthesis C-methylase UbiE